MTTDKQIITYNHNSRNLRRAFDLGSHHTHYLSLYCTRFLLAGYCQHWMYTVQQHSSSSCLPASSLTISRYLSLFLSHYHSLSLFHLVTAICIILIDLCILWLNRKKFSKKWIFLKDILNDSVTFSPLCFIVQWTVDLRKISTCKFTNIGHFSGRPVFRSSRQIFLKSSITRFMEGKMEFFKSRFACNRSATDTCNRYGPRFFDQVGYQTMYASMGNKQFFH